METRNASRRYVLLTAVNCTGDGLRKNHRMLPLACRERISLSGRRYTAITTETHVGHTHPRFPPGRMLYGGSAPQTTDSSFLGCFQRLLSRSTSAKRPL